VWLEKKEAGEIESWDGDGKEGGVPASLVLPEHRIVPWTWKNVASLPRGETRRVYTTRKSKKGRKFAVLSDRLTLRKKRTPGRVKR